MDVSTYLSQNGYAATALSDDLKGILGRVLQTAGYSAIQELTALLQAKNRAAGQPATDAAKALQDAKAVEEALNELQLEQDRKAKRKKQLYILLGVIAALALGATLAIYLHKRKRSHE